MPPRPGFVPLSGGFPENSLKNFLPFAHLIYTIAFDSPGRPFHETMAKLLVSSIFRTGFSGDVLVLTNSPHRLFDNRRRNLSEMSFDTSKISPSGLGAEAQRFKFGAREFINVKKYDRIMFVDCDCLCLSNPDGMLTGDEVIAYSQETFTKITEPGNNAYLDDGEMEQLDSPGINSGIWWVKATHFGEVLTAWERIDARPPCREKGFGEQPAWVRFLLDTPLPRRTFLYDQDVKYPLLEKRVAMDADDCVIQHFCGVWKTTDKLKHLYAAYVRRFHAESVFGMLTWLDG